MTAFEENGNNEVMAKMEIFRKFLYFSSKLYKKMKGIKSFI